MLDMQTAQGASLTGHGEVTTSVLLSACLTTASASGLNRRGDLRNVHCLEKQDPQKMWWDNIMLLQSNVFFWTKLGHLMFHRTQNVGESLSLTWWLWFSGVLFVCLVCLCGYFCCSGYMWSLFIKLQALGCYLKFCITTNSDVHSQIGRARGVLTHSLWTSNTDAVF